MASAFLLVIAGCTRNQADMGAPVEKNVAVLEKFIVLSPRPVEAQWSVERIGKDASFGPTDSALWAVLRYADADTAKVSDMIARQPAVGPASAASVPAWLAADPQISRFRRGDGYEFGDSAKAPAPFASPPFSNGFAVRLPDERVLIHLSSQ